MAIVAAPGAEGGFKEPEEIAVLGEEDSMKVYAEGLVDVVAAVDSAGDLAGREFGREFGDAENGVDVLFTPQWS